MTPSGADLPEVTCVVFAHNEEHTIDAALQALGAQSIWERATGEVLVACNGCTDGTAAVVRRRQDLEPAGSPRIDLVELPRPGKSRTWNAVRDLLVDRGARGTVVFMDADIGLVEPGSIEGIVSRLDQDPAAWVASCVPARSVPAGTGVLGRLMFRASNDTGGDHRVWGGLYGMRAGTVASTVMPEGLPLEDGYLAAMMITEHLNAEPDFARVAQTGSSFAVRSDPSLRRALRRRTRMLLGVTVNHVLFSWIRGDAQRFDVTESVSRIDATEWIEAQNQADPDWLGGLMARYATGRRLPIPTYLIAGDSSASGSRVARLARRAPQIAFGLVAYAWATVEFRRNGGIGFW